MLEAVRRAVAAALAILLAVGMVGCAGDDALQEEDKTDKFEVKETFVQRGELTIYGKLYLPTDREGRIPAVILSHSSGLDCDSMQPYCEEFANRGYAAYAFDFCGGSSHSKSDGEEADMTVFTETDDLKAVFEEISSFGFVDSDEVYLFGTSQGGLVSALAANDLADRVKGLILLYPAFNIPELVGKYESVANSVLGQLGITLANEKFVESLKGYDPYAHIANFHGEVLILHGSQDFIVNPSYSQKAAEVYDHCEVKIIEGATHGFNAANQVLFGNYDARVWEEIDAYLARQSADADGASI